jgi:hypothetical protein
MKIRKVLTVTLCALIIAAVFAVAVPRNVGAADPVTIYVDMRGIDDRPDLTAEQKQQLKEAIIWDIQWNFNNSVGPGKVEVTMDPAKEAGSTRQVRITNDTGTGINAKGNREYWYGEWDPRKPSETKVHLQNFLDRHGSDYKDGGAWNITKLRRGIGHSCSHELGHSYCIGHNNFTGTDANKMTEGGNIPSADRANREWVFDMYCKNVLTTNLDQPPCKSVVDYSWDALLAHFWNGPDRLHDADDQGGVDVLFNYSGSLAAEFELGWYGVDTDNGVYDGNSKFDFIYKTGMLPDPEQNAEMLTFFEGITDKVQFLLRGAPGSPWEGHWFPLDDANVVLEDFVVTPSYAVVARKVSMGWDVDGEPGLDVQITLDAANAFGNDTCPYNGFTYGRALQGEVNSDGTVDMADISLCIEAFMSHSTSPNWDARCDVNNDGSVDMADISLVIENFMLTEP